MGRIRTAEDRLAEHERKTRRTEIELARQRSVALDDLYKLHRKLVSWSIDHKLACDNATHEAIGQIGKRVDQLVDLALERRANEEAGPEMFAERAL